MTTASSSRPTISINTNFTAKFSKKLARKSQNRFGTTHKAGKRRSKRYSKKPIVKVSNVSESDGIGSE